MDGEALIQTALICLSVCVNQGDTKQNGQRCFSRALSPPHFRGLTPFLVSLSLFWVPSGWETGCSWQRSVLANWLVFSTCCRGKYRLFLFLVLLKALLLLQVCLSCRFKPVLLVRHQSVLYTDVFEEGICNCSLICSDKLLGLYHLGRGHY